MSDVMLDQSTAETVSRRSRRGPRQKGALRQKPWARFQNRLPPVEVLSQDEVESIRLASLKLLSEVGMEMHDAWAREVMQQAGCDVDHGTMRVRFDPSFVEEQLAKAPSTFTIRARNPERNLTLGGNHINIGSVIGPPYCSDLDRGRRNGNTQDVRNFVRLLQSLNTIHYLYGTPFEAMELAPEIRHLQGYINGIELTDKVWGSWMLGRSRAEDAINMACMVFDTDRDGLAAQPALMANINTNSPLVLDAAMTHGARAFAETGQAVVVTPFTLAGAMAPATLAGALVGQNAEAIAAITLLQTVRPGLPCVYGSFTSNVDMRTGAPAFGTPEYAQAVFASGQLARLQGLPWRSSNACASNVEDVQAAYESEMSIWSTVMSHCNLMIHGGGWLEGGLTASFEKLILDAEMLQVMTAALQPIDVSPATLGLEAFKEVGPGGHFFGAADTLQRYENAFYEPMVTDWSNFENWRDRGSLTATQRANGIWKKMLDEYEAPAINPDLLADLKAYAAQREAEIASGIGTD
ncbi:trimethylamine methyltransferase family protein [Xinfangfangia sp. CPCC 101601]|uniref:Methyltransferase n=1 Tax=Pseudogemmobacter lacusdianii TaxID=3069608 RepID=A0ABU0W3E5_9RHOB|nr:trimethylamine methyltransferase family protein [Xinfangfangia sp. CPCC 101601]MDQ2067605.1 trimethylamine methyltransferase family protein [Xinfangfangia sp. CPCC 101601]